MKHGSTTLPPAHALLIHTVQRVPGGLGCERGLGISDLVTWPDLLWFAHSPPRLKESVIQIGKGFVCHIPVCLCHCEHQHYCLTPDSNSQPRLGSGPAGV